MWPGVGAAKSECGRGWVRPSLSVAGRCAVSLSVAGGGAAESRVWPGRCGQVLVERLELDVCWGGVPHGVHIYGTWVPK